MALTRATWKRLEPWVDQALELTPTQRQQWLSQLSVDSPELASELSVLLGSGAADDEPPLLRDLPEPGLVGVEIGAYRLERELGRGGMGSVWFGRRSDGRFDGFAAIKLLHLSAMDAAGLARFKREASALARLTHSGIAKLLDAGVSRTGQPFLVLEYVDGEPIDAFADARRLGRAERLQLFLQVLAAVQHAHAHLIVHRDIKPSNILITADGTAKLLDFGIARLLGGDERATLTRERSPFTPLFAAPEQISGNDLSTATDVYALGVLLYLLLSGRHPTAQNLSNPLDCVRSILEVEPSPLGLGDLDAILGKALRKVPADRYQTVAALADDLGRYVRHEPVVARAQPLWYRAGRFARRHRLVLGLGAIAAGSLLASTVTSLLSLREAERQRDKALREGRRADAQVEFQNLMLSSAGERCVTMRQILDSGRQLIEHQHAGQEDVLAQLLLQLSHGYAQFYELDVRAELLARAEALALAGQAHDLLPEIRCEQADNLRSRGRYKEARRAFEDTRRLLSADADPVQRAACLAREAALGSETGEPPNSAEAAREALRLLEGAGKQRTLRYFDTRAELAEALKAEHRDREAVAVYRQAIAEMLESGLRATSELSVMQHNLALLLFRLGQTAESEAMLRDGLDQARAANPGGKQNWQPLIHFAEAALVQGDAGAAFESFRATVDQAVAENNLYWEGRGSYGLARAAVALSRTSEAERASARLAQIIDQYPHVLDTDDVVPDVDVVQGLILKASGDWAGALQRFESSLSRHGFRAGKKKRRLMPIVVLAAEAALGAGSPGSAKDYAREALGVARVDDLAEAESTFVGQALALEGRAWLAQGNRDEALLALRKALVALRAGAGPSHPATLEVDSLLGAHSPAGASAPGH